MSKLRSNLWATVLSLFAAFAVAAVLTDSASGFQGDQDQSVSSKNEKSSETSKEDEGGASDNDGENAGDQAAGGDIAFPWYAYLIPVLGIAGLGFTFWKSQWVSQQEVGNERMAGIAKNITEGAMSFLKAEYSVLAIFVVGVAVLLGWAGSTQVDADGNAISSPLIALSFVLGALCSGLAGFIGMKVATQANVRTTNAAQSGLAKALEVAFAGGSVMGMGVVGLGVLGLSALFLIYSIMFGYGSESELGRVITVLTGFSFGASSIALFARVGGGIYTKAADVGADLVGKVEAGIPEDHPLNPATIADNVGDNVGDVAGMGADLFESYVGSIIGTMVLGAAFMMLPEFAGGYELNAVILPLVLAGVGILTSIGGDLSCQNQGRRESSPRFEYRRSRFRSDLAGLNLCDHQDDVAIILGIHGSSGGENDHHYK